MVQESNMLVPNLAQTMDGWQEEDPRMQKNLPVGVDMPHCFDLFCFGPDKM